MKVPARAIQSALGIAFSGMLLVSAAWAQEKKPPAQSKARSVAAAKPSSAEVAEQQKSHVATLRGTLANCSEEFRTYLAFAQLTSMQREAQRELREAEARYRASGGEPGGAATEKVKEPVERHRVCAANAKEQFAAPSRQFIKTFKGDSQGRAADLVAQWMTAMDGIGTKTSSDEVSRFETLANRLLLEL